MCTCPCVCLCVCVCGCARVLSFDVLSPRILLVAFFYLLGTLAALLQHADQIDLLILSTIRETIR